MGLKRVVTTTIDDASAYRDAVESARGLPLLEGEWNTGGLHVIGPDPDNPALLYREHDDSIATDGTNFSYPYAEDLDVPQTSLPVKFGPGGKMTQMSAVNVPDGANVDDDDATVWTPVADVPTEEPLEDPGDAKPIEEQPADVGQLKGR
jgi:hypothetical protein